MPSVAAIENKFTKTRAHFTIGKKIVSAFLQIFQLMLDQNHRYLMNYLDVYDQNIISKYVSVTQNHLGGDIRGHLFFIA